MVNIDDVTKIKEIIDRAINIHVYTHAFPDGDAIASMASVYHLLNWLGKNVTCRCDTVISPMYNWLQVPITSIHSIPKPETIITLDFGSFSQLGKLYSSVKDQFVSVPVINIDHHHLTNDNFGTVNLVNNTASTTTILFELFNLWPYPINEVVASFLYFGLLTDTYFFEKANTNAYALSVASELARLGANPSKMALKANKTKSELALRVWGEIISSLHTYSSGQIVVGRVNMEIIRKYKTPENYLNLDGLINFLTSIQTSKVTVVLKERSDEIRVSLRSDIYEEDQNILKLTDVSKIARQFGGGGHKGAAGCSLKASLEEAEEIIVNACIMALQDPSYSQSLNDEDVL